MEDVIRLATIPKGWKGEKRSKFHETSGLPQTSDGLSRKTTPSMSCEQIKKKKERNSSVLCNK